MSTTKPIEIDDRRGLPSASSFNRYMRCPASLGLETQMRREGTLPADRGNKDANRGTRVHEVLESLARGSEIPSASIAEATQARQLWQDAQGVIAQVFGADLSDVDFIIEERLWFEDAHGEDVASGRFDLMAYSEARAIGLVLDYKTGWNDVAPPSDNWQLFAGAVLLSHEIDVESVTVAIIDGSEPKPYTISSACIVFAREQLDSMLHRRNGDPWALGYSATDDNCRYCPCRLQCPRLAWAMELAQRGIVSMANFPTPRLGEFLTACSQVALLDKAARAEMEHRLRNGETDTAWYLEAAAPRRTVTDAGTLARAIIAEGAEVGEVLAAMTISIGAAESLLADATGLKGKVLKERMADISGGSITMRELEPTLKRR